MRYVDRSRLSTGAIGWFSAKLDPETYPPFLIWPASIGMVAEAPAFAVSIAKSSSSAILETLLVLYLFDSTSRLFVSDCLQRLDEEKNVCSHLVSPRWRSLDSHESSQPHQRSVAHYSRCPAWARRQPQNCAVVRPPPVAIGHKVTPASFRISMSFNWTSAIRSSKI